MYTYFLFTFIYHNYRLSTIICVKKMAIVDNIIERRE